MVAVKSWEDRTSAEDTRRGLAVTGIRPLAAKPTSPETGDAYLDKDTRQLRVYVGNGQWNILAPTGSVPAPQERLTRLDAYGCCLTCGAPHDGGHRCRHCRNMIYL